MSHALEARYRRLLRAYPADYRSERGAEMIGTLMEAAGPDQRRPTAREAVALIVRGLQVRAGGNRRRSQAQTWLGALRLAVLLLLTYATAAALARAGAVVTDTIADGELGFIGNLGKPLALLLAVAALLAVARGRYAWGLLATAGATFVVLGVEILSYNTDVDFVAGEFTYTVNRWSPSWIVDGLPMSLILPEAWSLPVAALLTVPLLRWKVAAAGRPLAWLLAVPAAVVLLPTAYAVTTGLQPWATFAVMAGFLVWVAVDARGTLAGAALVLPLVLVPLNFYLWPSWVRTDELINASFWSYLAGMVALVAAGAVRARQQARI
ncbi:hypothetical protein [Phytohabitans rumicis]|uniref:Uncharacterized protein n=1 Tax=Phytohabitans rumicis TaxID=1076125 RepID=A0A6V8L621_9ACTN|nr:hypothetical protein [Phytohabitans rumicis]GFJ90069.1 hypothetical protein Prum_037110 [Phytohabitans rumicis]